MHFNSHPPTEHHSAQLISQSTAQAFVARYLERARRDPALRPDAEFTQAGVAFSTHSGDLGLGLKGLVDFEAGLRGTRVHDTESLVEGEAELQDVGKDEDEWMEKEAFERMQEDEIGGGEEEGKLRAKEGTDIPGPQHDASLKTSALENESHKEHKPISKEERKALKKARRKGERRALATQAETANV